MEIAASVDLRNSSVVAVAAVAASCMEEDTEILVAVLAVANDMDFEVVRTNILELALVAVLHGC